MSQHLKTYLNDHLAASEGAIELLKGVMASHPKTPSANLAEKLVFEFSAEQVQLRDVMNRAEATISVMRKMAGWAAARASELKLTVDDRANGKFRLFETFEMVSIGIAGKRLLWHALNVISRGDQRLAGVNYTSLEAQAKRQREDVEELRLKIAIDLFV